MKNIFEPLSDEELDWLGDFILDRIDEDTDVGDQDDGVLDVSDLDGFFTAVVSGPIMIPPSRWMPKIWGDFQPVYEDEQAAQHVMSLLMRHMNSIAATLMEHPEDFEPLFMERIVDDKTYIIVDEWCEGYIRGVEMIAPLWNLDEVEMKILLAPIHAFEGKQAFLTHDSFSEKEIRNLQDAIKPAALEIHAYWLARRSADASVTTVRRAEPKVGRNDPCICGSGKKFKKCCLH